MTRIPVYLSQDEADELCQLLYTHQTLVNTASSDRPTSERAFRYLSLVREQFVIRSGGDDPFPYMPLASTTFVSGIDAKRTAVRREGEC